MIHGRRDVWTSSVVIAADTWHELMGRYSFSVPTPLTGTKAQGLKAARERAGSYIHVQGFLQSTTAFAEVEAG